MVSYFCRIEGNKFSTKQSRLPLIIGVVVGVVVILCVAIVCIVIVCRRRKPDTIPTSKNELAVQNKENPSQNHVNQAHQPHANQPYGPHAIATSISEPYPNCQNQQNSLSIFNWGLISIRDAWTTCTRLIWFGHTFMAHTLLLVTRRSLSPPYY